MTEDHTCTFRIHNRLTFDVSLDESNSELQQGEWDSKPSNGTVTRHSTSGYFKLKEVAGSEAGTQALLKFKGTHHEKNVNFELNVRCDGKSHNVAVIKPNNDHLLLSVAHYDPLQTGELNVDFIVERRIAGITRE